MVPVFYSPNYVLSEFSLETTRKAGWIADSLSRDPIEGIQLVPPRPLTPSELIETHSAEYIDALESGEPRSLAESQGFRWDRQLFEMVCSSNGGMVASVEAALVNRVSGSLSSGMHHVRHGSGLALCTVNGLAVAARHAITKGAKSILILDLDAHCGGGTAELILGIPEIYHLDIAVNNFDQYESTENSFLVLVEDGDDYLLHVELELEALIAHRQFELCIYNAGMDPFERCVVGGRIGVTRHMLAQREKLVFEWCRSHCIPIAFTVAGGYIGGRLDQQELVDLHRLTPYFAADYARRWRAGAQDPS